MKHFVTERLTLLVGHGSILVCLSIELHVHFISDIVFYHLVKYFVGEEGTDVVFSDFGREWEVLRRVAYGSVRKYAVHDQLPTLIADIVDEVVDTIKKNHGSQPFDIKEYLFLMTFNILAQISYGQK